METSKEHFHGSDLEKIEKYFGIKKEDIVNFAANVNPLGISFKLREELSSHIDAITSYPDREYTSLRKAIGKYAKCDFNNIIVGNGSTELISLVAKKIKPKNALILGPTYSEYEHEISLCGGKASFFELKEENDFELIENDLIEELTDEFDLLVICNPNNPTSKQIETDNMRNIVSHCKKNNIFVMVDETYVEFTEKYSSVTSIPLTKDFDNLIVLRGISKFFAAPGLRLGYGITGNKKLLDGMNALINPWAINSLAAIAGEIMFDDKDYIEKTYSLISSERKRICGLLDNISNLKYYSPHGNFILCRILDKKVTSETLFKNAIKNGLMIRDCSSFPFLDDTYFRFCIMKPSDNDALLKVLSETMSFEANQV